MPLLTLHLLRLDPSVEIPKFLRAFGDEPNVELVVASQPRHPVIRPTRVDADQLMSKPWDLMVLIRSPANALPTSLRSAVREEYKLDVGISSKLLSHYRQHDQGLKDKAARVPLSGALEKAQARPSSQNLELSPDLIAFMEELSKDYDKPVTMLNLLSFQEGGKPKYYQYGQVCSGPLPSRSWALPIAGLTRCVCVCV